MNIVNANLSKLEAEKGMKKRLGNAARLDQLVLPSNLLQRD